MKQHALNKGMVLSTQNVHFVATTENQDEYKQWTVTAPPSTPKRRLSTSDWAHFHDSKMDGRTEYNQKFKKHIVPTTGECPCVSQKLPRKCRPGRVHRYFVYKDDQTEDGQLEDPKDAEYIRASTVMHNKQIYGATPVAPTTHNYMDLNRGGIVYIDDGNNL